MLRIVFYQIYLFDKNCQLDKSNQYYTAVLLDQYQPQLLTYMSHQYHTIIIMIIMIIMIVTIIMITCIGLFSLICVSAFNALQSSLSIR